MKKKNFGLLIFVAGLLLLGINAYAADGDLIVNGQLQVTGEVRVYRLPSICEGGINDANLTTSSTCYTRVCTPGEDPYYYNCNAACVEYGQMQCNTVYVGKLFP